MRRGEFTKSSTSASREHSYPREDQTAWQSHVCTYWAAFLLLTLDTSRPYIPIDSLYEEG